MGSSRYTEPTGVAIGRGQQMTRCMMSKVGAGGALGMRKRRKAPVASELVAAVVAVMKSELSATAADRWRALLDAELRQTIFSSPLAIRMLPNMAPRSPKKTTPAVLPLTRPKLTAAVLEAFTSDEVLADGEPVRLGVAGCIGADGGLEKLLTRRVVVWLQERKPELLQAGGELCDAKLGDKVRLEKTLSRITYDAIQYVHARAMAALENDREVVLELQSADQTLAGKPLRGCGLVYCGRGRLLFEQAVTEARVGSVCEP